MLPLFYQLPGCFDLVPDVAHHRAPHFTVLSVLNDSRVVFLLPVSESLKIGINFSYSLIAELEEVGEEIRHVSKWLVGAGHIPSCLFPLIERAVPVFEPHLLSQHLIRE